MKEPQIKVFSAWEYVGSEVLKTWKAWKAKPKTPITGSQIVAVLTVAINPATLAESVRNVKAHELARVFGEFYAAEPELTLKLLGVIRKKWNDQSITAKVQRHLLSKAWHVRPIVKHHKWIQQGVFHHEVKDADLRVVVSPKESITLDAVKKARQRACPPVWRPTTSVELHNALQELRAQGLDVGLGS